MPLGKFHEPGRAACCAQRARISELLGLPAGAQQEVESRAVTDVLLQQEREAEERREQEERRKQVGRPGVANK